MQLLLHEQTLRRIHPCIRDALDPRIRNGSIRPCLDADVATLTTVLIRGVEGIISSANLSSASKKEMKKLEKTIGDYVRLLLEI
jgi:hypothetical protein